MMKMEKVRKLKSDHPVNQSQSLIQYIYIHTYIYKCVCFLFRCHFSFCILLAMDKSLVSSIGSIQYRTYAYTHNDSFSSFFFFFIFFGKLPVQIGRPFSKYKLNFQCARVSMWPIVCFYHLSCSGSIVIFQCSLYINLHYELYIKTILKLVQQESID